MKLRIEYSAGWSREVDDNPRNAIKNAAEDLDRNGQVSAVIILSAMEEKIFERSKVRGGFSAGFWYDKQYYETAQDLNLDYEEAWDHPAHHDWI